jgi:hypothetical protein
LVCCCSRAKIVKIMHNCVSCLFPNVDGQIDLSFVIVPTKLCHMLSRQSMGVDTMLVYDWCSRGWHMGCLTLLLDKVPVNK